MRLAYFALFTPLATHNELLVLECRALVVHGRRLGGGAQDN